MIQLGVLEGAVSTPSPPSAGVLKSFEISTILIAQELHFPNYHGGNWKIVGHFWRT